MRRDILYKRSLIKYLNLFLQIVTYTGFVDICKPFKSIRQIFAQIIHIGEMILKYIIKRVIPLRKFTVEFSQIIFRNISCLFHVEY